MYIDINLLHFLVNIPSHCYLEDPSGATVPSQRREQTIVYVTTRSLSHNPHYSLSTEDARASSILKSSIVFAMSFALHPFESAILASAPCLTSQAVASICRSSTLQCNGVPWLHFGLRLSVTSLLIPCSFLTPVLERAE